MPKEKEKLVFTYAVPILAVLVGIIGPMVIYASVDTQNRP